MCINESPQYVIREITNIEEHDKDSDYGEVE